MARGICYYCDKPFERGHKCASRNSQLFLVEVQGSDETDEEECQNVEELVQTEPQISINAIRGQPRYHTMRVTGYFGQKTLHILIDSGSTHNFLDLALARKLGCKLDPVFDQSVTIADGN